MGSNNNNAQFPKVLIDQANDFASIKIKDGIESKSYLKDGFVFCEDKDGNVIEVQILNLSDLSRIDGLIAS